MTFGPFHYRLVPEHINEISISLGWQLLSFPQSKIGEKNAAYYYNIQNLSLSVKVSISFKLQSQSLPTFNIQTSNFKYRKVLSGILTQNIYSLMMTSI